MTQTDLHEKPVTFDCKDSGCTEKVTYEREEVLGFKSHEDEAAKEKVVYLTCNNGHIHPYTIERG